MSKVYLIGAGPGDPGLLTIKAREVLSCCDVLIYDYLANAEFLSYAKPEAEIIYVGKKGGDHTLPQDKINELIIAKAREGKSIARLKGGDPYVFGRGGEEAEELVEVGIEFEVIPGVTAGVAAPAYAGIPVTHREHTTSVCFITGHEDPTKEQSGHDWAVYASSSSTLVFYMGIKNLPMISRNLIENGRDPQTPVALIRWGTRAEQQSFVSTLEKVAEEAKTRGFKAPSIIVVGGVCSLHDKLAWFEKRALLGKGVVVTRAREQSSGLVNTLGELGAKVYEFPTIAIQPLADYTPVQKEIQNLAAWDCCVFTSVNGVKKFFEQIDYLKLDARIFAGLYIAAIGPATALALQEKGIKPDFVPEKYVAEHVLKGMLEHGVAGKKILIPRAQKAREVLPEKLQEAGAEVLVLPVYKTSLSQEDPTEISTALEQNKIQYITFTSSSTVDNFFTLLKPELLQQYRDKIQLACIGPITAETLASYGFTPDIQPEKYTIVALVDALVKNMNT